MSLRPVVIFPECSASGQGASRYDDRTHRGREKPRRRYTGNQIFPVVAALMFALSAVLWWPVLQAGNGTFDEHETFLLIGAVFY